MCVCVCVWTDISPFYVGLHDLKFHALKYMKLCHVNQHKAVSVYFKLILFCWPVFEHLKKKKKKKTKKKKKKKRFFF